MPRRSSGASLASTNPRETALVTHAWPGNVRELQNVLRRAVVLQDGKALTGRHVAVAQWRRADGRSTTGLGAFGRTCTDRAGPRLRLVGAGEPDIVALWRVEKAAIDRAIELCRGNVPRAAAFLSVSPSTIYRKKQAWTAGEEG